MPRAVSDSSTLIHLASVGHMRLLRELYDEVVIPPAVWNEVVEEGQGRAGAREVVDATRSGWIKVKAPTNELFVRLLRRDLDDGEAETIVLAMEQSAEIVLLDETDARKIAGIYGLNKTGVIGLFIRARIEGKIASLRQELDRLRHEGGFWMSEELYQKALEAVGEDS